MSAFIFLQKLQFCPRRAPSESHRCRPVSPIHSPESPSLSANIIPARHLICSEPRRRPRLSSQELNACKVIAFLSPCSCLLSLQPESLNEASEHVLSAQSTQAESKQSPFKAACDFFPLCGSPEVRGNAARHGRFNAEQFNGCQTVGTILCGCVARGRLSRRLTLLHEGTPPCA